MDRVASKATKVAEFLKEFSFEKYSLAASLATCMYTYFPLL